MDCSANAIPPNNPQPIFAGDLIRPQLVRPYQPAFSAAMIAHVELNYETEEDKNRLCGVVPLPNTTEDFIQFTLAGMINQQQWSKDGALRKWIAANRLDGPSKLLLTISEDDQAQMAVLGRIRSASPGAFMKLQQFVSAQS